MLVIVMHSRKDYLEMLRKAVVKSGIPNTTIIEKERLGNHLVRYGANLVFQRGRLIPTYKQAFISVVNDEKGVRKIIDIIDNDTALSGFNMEEDGFICTVPFHQVVNLELESVKKKEASAMRVCDVLKEDKIIMDLKSSNKDDAIAEIAGLLREDAVVVDFDKFLTDISERESLGTTAIGNYVAIPHARTDSVRSFVIAFGRSQNGIDFNAVDGKPAKLIFVMGTPKEKGINDYLKVLAHLTRILQKEKFRGELFTAQTPSDVITAFRKVEER